MKQTRTITVNDIQGPDAPRIKAIVEENRLKPKREDLKKLGRYWEKENPKAPGGWEWGVKMAPNDGQGKHSRQGQALMEAMKPYWRANNERMSKGKPGSYGLVSRGKVTLLAQSVEDQFCPKCDLRWSWCGCGTEAV